MVSGQDFEEKDHSSLKPDALAFQASINMLDEVRALQLGNLIGNDAQTNGLNRTTVDMSGQQPSTEIWRRGDTARAQAGLVYNNAFGPTQAAIKDDFKALNS